MNLRRLPACFAALLLLPALFASCSKKPAAAAAGSAPQSPIPAQPPQDSGAADLSTPKKAALAFANSVAAGDSAAMGKMADGEGTRMFAFYAGFADMVASEHLFAAALKAKFGDDCVIPPDIERIGNPPSMPSNYEQLAEQIDGDTAKLVDANGHPGVRLKKAGGGWKVDLRATDAALSPEAAANYQKALDQFAVTKNGFNQTTAKVLDGVYTDCQAALDAVKTAIGPQP